MMIGAKEAILGIFGFSKKILKAKKFQNGLLYSRKSFSPMFFRFPETPLWRLDFKSILRFFTKNNRSFYVDISDILILAYMLSNLPVSSKHFFNFETSFQMCSAYETCASSFLFNEEQCNWYVFKQFLSNSYTGLQVYVVVQWKVISEISFLCRNYPITSRFCDI